MSTFKFDLLKNVPATASTTQTARVRSLELIGRLHHVITIEPPCTSGNGNGGRCAGPIRIPSTEPVIGEDEAAASSLPLLRSWLLLPSFYTVENTDEAYSTRGGGGEEFQIDKRILSLKIKTYFFAQ